MLSSLYFLGAVYRPLLHYSDRLSGENRIISVFFLTSVGLAILITYGIRLYSSLSRFTESVWGDFTLDHPSEDQLTDRQFSRINEYFQDEIERSRVYQPEKSELPVLGWYIYGPFIVGMIAQLALIWHLGTGESLQRMTESILQGTGLSLIVAIAASLHPVVAVVLLSITFIGNTPQSATAILIIVGIPSVIFTVPCWNGILVFERVHYKLISRIKGKSENKIPKMPVLGVVQVLYLVSIFLLYYLSMQIFGLN